MNKSVILLTDYYFPNNSANGLCVSRIGKAMLEMGYDVHVIAYKGIGDSKEECIDNINVHRVKPMFFFAMREYYYKHTNTLSGKICWTLALMQRRIKKILFVYWYPLVSPAAAKRYINRIEEVAKKYDITNIIAGYNPFEAAAASIALKKKKRLYKIIAYFMDTFTMTANAKKSKIIYNRGRFWEDKIFQSVDMITNFPLYKEHFESKVYDKYRNKMQYADVPVDFYELDKVQIPSSYKKEYVTFVYTGSLKMGDREPNYLLEIFNAATEKSACKLHFYGQGDCGDFIEEYQKKNENIVNHGYVSFEELMIARKTADFMVNVGSKREVILPSRLLEHIASGKPIIHINYREDDPCVMYLKKHPCSLVLEVKDKYDDNVKKMREFINKFTGKSIDTKKMEQLYYENSAIYIAKLFDQEFTKTKNSM